MFLLVQQYPVIEQFGIVDAVGIADQRISISAQIEQFVPVGIVQGSPILPVFLLMKSRFIIVFIPWPDFPCGFADTTGDLTGHC